MPTWKLDAGFLWPRVIVVGIKYLDKNEHDAQCDNNEVFYQALVCEANEVMHYG